VAGKTDSFLGERYRRIARRRGKKKSIVAIGRSLLTPKQKLEHVIAYEEALDKGEGGAYLRSRGPVLLWSSSGT
jgi:hypothetical protein